MIEIKQEVKTSVTCPKCDGGMTFYSYNPVFKILKERRWFFCATCKFEETVAEYNKRVFVA